jgi:hypothetical protein
MEDFDIFYGHLFSFTSIRYILWPFGVFYGYLVFFPVLVCCMYEGKSGNPGSDTS